MEIIFKSTQIFIVKNIFDIHVVNIKLVYRCFEFFFIKFYIDKCHILPRKYYCIGINRNIHNSAQKCYCITINGNNI